MSFLKAEWRKLVLINYVCSEQSLRPYLPAGTELDPWRGKYLVSLVGFMFCNVRVLGLKIPFHVNFEEVNLRFYVRQKTASGEWRRGVVFIKEIVPRPAITLVANTLYREHYATHRMKHEWQSDEEGLRVGYSWKESGVWHRFGAEAELGAQPIAAGDIAEFITEHYYGYTRVSERKTYEYEVTHPRWLHYPVKRYWVEVDFGKVYGAAYAYLNDQSPHSIQLAEGSPITVEQKRTLRR